MDTPQVFPLSYPLGKPRTPAWERKRASFSKGTGAEKSRLSVPQAAQRLTEELRRLGVLDFVLSTNVQVRLDGFPRAGQAEPHDPGAALYFLFDGRPTAFGADQYDRVADNIAAIAAHIEATRAIERHGVGTLAQAFAGYVALPSPEMVGRSWREVFGFSPNHRPNAAELRAEFHDLARRRHPDAEGGSTEAMAELNNALEQAEKELSFA